ncbi:MULTISPECIES: Uma2 family endonuclease [unclassified Nocardiopsis]|uniref:Uma2 family endonuclease n=1 Tax=unclassified Nocardiopsis TaxID=2649073 RepID=UPI001F5BCE64|nr:Uma2 family endonuclease [Nocardiopsis sp. TSRI0078]
MDLPTLADSLELPEGFRAEIINGSIIVSPTPTYRHAKIVRMVERALDRSRCEGLLALQMATVELSATGERYVPDLVVMPEALVDGEGWEGPDWIRPAEEAEFAVEVVSPGSALHDWQAKARGYAKAGVPLYLVVDPRRSEIALFSEPKGEEYQEVARAVRGGTVRLPEPFGIEIEASSLLT